jgi:hypothetical protein
MVTSKDGMEFSELQALGVPLDGRVMEHSRTAELGLYLRIFESPIDCTILDAQLGGTFLMIPVIICNESPRVIRLDQCRIELPWHDPDFRLLEDPWRKAPRENKYSSENAPRLSFDREVALNHRFGRQGRLNPGDSLDGLILGAGSQAIPDQYHHREGVDVPLVIIDGKGKMYQESARVILDRSEQLKRQKESRACKRQESVQEKADQRRNTDMAGLLNTGSGRIRIG